jgi:hypothetical protein
MSDFDLFGDPVRLPNGKRGRPAHVATQENRNKVMMLLAVGWSNDRIANAMRVSLPTLRKHYFSELKARSIQRDRLDAARFMMAFEQAAAGNVGAQRLLAQLIEKNDQVLTDAKIRTAARDDAADEPLGKKEQARREAEQALAGGAWGDDLKPGQFN